MKKIILYNIRSAYNVGAIFRTADGAGVAKIYLVGTTPTPLDRFGRPQADIIKTSLGASETVEWEQIGEANDFSLSAAQDLIGLLKQESCTVVAIEQTPQAISLNDFVVPNKVAYIFGHEVDGVPKELTQLADLVVEIPMLGQKESLNVSVTAGIVLFKR